MIVILRNPQRSIIHAYISVKRDIYFPNINLAQGSFYNESKQNSIKSDLIKLEQLFSMLFLIVLIHKYYVNVAKQFLLNQILISLYYRK